MSGRTYVCMIDNGCDVIWDSFSCVRLDSRLNLRNLRHKAFEIYESYLKWKPNSINGFRIFRCSSLLDDCNNTIYRYEENENGNDN